MNILLAYPPRDFSAEMRRRSVRARREGLARGGMSRRRLPEDIRGAIGQGLTSSRNQPNGRTGSKLSSGTTPGIGSA